MKFLDKLKKKGDDVETTKINPETKDMKKKKKYQFKKRHLILLAAFLIVIGAGGYFAINFFASTGVPVYGDRCSNVIKLDKKKVKQITEEYKATRTPILELKTDIECREVRVTLKVNEEYNANDAAYVFEEFAKYLDQHLEQPFTEGRTFSNLFYYQDGLPQYDIVGYIYGTEGAESFPIMVNKHYKYDEVKFTFNRPVNPDLANELRAAAEAKRQEEEEKKNQNNQTNENTENSEEKKDENSGG